MIDNIKDSIWNVLKNKEISLAMIFNNQGEILWHRGREIFKSKSLVRGGGYCTSLALQALTDKKKCRRESCIANYMDLSHSESANILNVKSLLIIPITDQYMLYVDSGNKEGFLEEDVTIIETLGKVLAGIIQNIQTGTGQTRRISGHSGKTRQIREKITKYAIEEEPVLLLGETGTGKSMIAELIHTGSGRPGQFVVVHTPGIPETLLESQLFGHTKGSFSGATADREGLVAAAAGGTLFLDEIAEVEPSLQAKLLRFIDTRMYYRLGENRERKADVRILAATNQNLLEAVKQKSFREDLFFRLNCLTIDIPPLRERREDIRDLIDENSHLLRNKTLTPQALEILLNYHWPGNIRELIQLLKMAGIHFEGPLIGAEIRETLSFRNADSESEARTGNADQVWQELMKGKSFWDSVKEPYLARDLNRREVKEIINRGLQETKGRYMGLMELFHMKESEYKNFMGFLYKNNLK